MIDETKYTKEVMADGKIVFTPIEQNGLFKFGPDGRGWYVGCEGTPFRSKTSKGCQELANYGNCFPDEETAEKAAALMCRANIFISAALSVDPDAGKWSPERRWTVWYNPCGYLDAGPATRQGAITAYVHTEDHARQMAEILKAEGWK